MEQKETPNLPGSSSVSRRELMKSVLASLLVAPLARYSTPSSPKTPTSSTQWNAPLTSVLRIKPILPLQPGDVISVYSTPSENTPDGSLSLWEILQCGHSQGTTMLRLRRYEGDLSPVAYLNAAYFPSYIQPLLCEEQALLDNLEKTSHTPNTWLKGANLTLT